jgi:hypothetical protein
MNRPDSTITFTIDERQSPHSQADDREQWGQPPANQYVFSVQGTAMRGYLLSSMPTSSPFTSANLASDYGYLLVETPGSVSDMQLEDWSILSDEDLAAVYEEVAEEDRLLAHLGLSHYAEILRQEEESE